jgi:hypothetical protein
VVVRLAENPRYEISLVTLAPVTPLFKVRLDDVLNRQHLPPLGLKDFEVRSKVLITEHYIKLLL